jgi:cell division protein FtsQ
LLSLNFGNGIRLGNRKMKSRRTVGRGRPRASVRRSAGSKAGTWQKRRRGSPKVDSVKITLLSWRLVMILLVFVTMTYALVKGGYIESLKSEVGTRIAKLLTNSGFGIEKIEISGQVQVTDDAIVQALYLPEGGATLTFDTEAAQKRLEKLPWIRRATVMRLLPSTLKVDIVETKPEMVWQKNNRLYLVDGDGGVISQVKQYRIGLPLIIGAGANKDAKQLLTELQTIPDMDRHLKAALRISDRRWTLVLQNGTQIWLPEQHYGIALRDLLQQRKYLDVFTHDWGAIDLRISDRIIVRRSRAMASSRSNSLRFSEFELDRKALIAKINQGI